MNNTQLKKHMRIIIPSPNATRRSYLDSLQTISGDFNFDGHPVCSTFYWINSILVDIFNSQYVVTKQMSPEIK